MSSGHIDLPGSVNDANPKKNERLDLVAGGYRIHQGGYGPSHNRVMPAAQIAHPGADTAGANTNARSWNLATQPNEVSIYPTAAAATSDDYVLVVIDASGGAVEKTFLDAVSAGDLIEEEFLYFKVPVNEKTVLPYSAAGIRRIGVKPTIVCHILLEAN